MVNKALAVLDGYCRRGSLNITNISSLREQPGQIRNVAHKWRPRGTDASFINVSRLSVNTRQHVSERRSNNLLVCFYCSRLKKNPDKITSKATGVNKMDTTPEKYDRSRFFLFRFRPSLTASGSSLPPPAAAHGAAAS